MAGVNHWGSLRDDKEPEHVPDVSADIELSMNKMFLSGLEEDEDDTVKTETIIVPPLNTQVLHAITLHKHVNHILDIIKSCEANKLSEKVEFKTPACNPCPKSDLNFAPEDFKNFQETQVGLLELSTTVVQQILIKCVATLFAQIGFETSQQSALDVVTDVLQEFLRKICRHVKVAIDDEERKFSGFPNVIERVLTEMGLGGVKALHDYYNARVVKYINVLENRCKDLTDEYEALLVPKSPSPVDKYHKVVRVKVEEEDVIEVENPEVHFSTIDGDVNFSILETGYQLLNSLEAETNLQNMGDVVEDISSVGESPGIVSLSSDDVVPSYSKKKRFK